MPEQAQVAPQTPQPVVVVDSPPKPSPEERILNIIAPKAPEKPRDEQGKFVSTKQEEPAEKPAEQAEQPQTGDDSPQTGDEPEPSWDELKSVKLKIPMKNADKEWEEELTLEQLREQRLMHADYTKKTQELAKQRQEAESKFKENFERQRGEYLAALAGLQQTIVSQMAPELRNVDWGKLASENPAEYVRLSNRAREVETAFNAIRGEQQKILQAHNEERQQALAKAVKESKEKIVAEIPNWNEDLYQSLLKRGVDTYGFAPQEVGQVFDHRFIRLLNDAHQFHKMQEEKPVIEKKVQDSPKVLKPGVAKPQQAKESAEYLAARESLKKTGKGEYDVFLSLLKKQGVKK